jgi:hypothetical protein
MAEGIYVATINELTAVADAIRAKGETTAGLVWPEGYMAAIEAISGGYKAALPTYTYDGSHVLQDEGEGNWTLTLFDSGTLNFSKLTTPIDVFLVGGGGGGGNVVKTYSGSGGGGGGYTATHKGVVADTSTDYVAMVGAGGGSAANGGYTSIFSLTANGGFAGSNTSGGNGGSGGGAGGYSINANAGNGGSDGSDGAVYYDSFAAGKGQGSTTRAFGEETGSLFSGGGGGGSGISGNYATSTPGLGGEGGGADGSDQQSGAGGSALDNTGGGGGGSPARNVSNAGGAGGSGIIIIRNAR